VLCLAILGIRSAIPVDNRPAGKACHCIPWPTAPTPCCSSDDAELQLSQLRNYSSSFNETFLAATVWTSSSIAIAGDATLGEWLSLQFLITHLPFRNARMQRPSSPRSFARRTWRPTAPASSSSVRSLQAVTLPRLIHRLRADTNDDVTNYVGSSAYPVPGIGRVQLGTRLTNRFTPCCSRFDLFLSWCCAAVVLGSWDATAHQYQYRLACLLAQLDVSTEDAASFVSVRSRDAASAATAPARTFPSRQ
jgi:hypothetical protein